MNKSSLAFSGKDGRLGRPCCAVGGSPSGRARPWILSLLLAAAGTVSAADSGLVGYWRFDKETNLVADLSGRGHAAQVSNAKTIIENGTSVLALDGRQKILVPSSPELNLHRGFSLVAKVKVSGALDRLIIVSKDKQYLLRIDQQEDGGHFSFFPYADNQWESRVRAQPPKIGVWYHLAATWDGSQAMLWVNGLPVSQPRSGDLPASSDAPLMILSSLPQGGICGAVEYVKLYRRTLSPKEIVTEAFGIAEAAASSADPSFDFAAGAGLEGWSTQEDARVALVGKQLVVVNKTPHSFVVNNRLSANIDKKDFVSLRMAVDKGSRARLIFVTTKGTGQIPFQTYDDRKPHTYVLDPWTVIGWGGDLLALGLIPSDLAENTAKIDYLQVGEAPRAAPDVQVDRIYTASTLPRAQRPERICVRLRNAAGASQALLATLSAPEGITVKSPASQPLPALDYRSEAELTWDVEAAQAVKGALRVTVYGPGLESPAACEQTLVFQADPHLATADYVPVPVPAKTPYTLWTHYCALWKHGTHYGWKKIEPWPERKPLLGWYNEGTPEVADWHIKFMVEHGISGVIYCWYRASVNQPVEQRLGHALDDGLLKARYLSMIKFGIMWENGCAEGVASTDDLMRNVLPFWIEHYFSNPQYIRFNGKPVLYIWVPSRLRKQLGGSEAVKTALSQMRAECERRGLGGLYIVGAQSQDKASIETMAKEGWDATSAYGNGWKQPEQLTVVGPYTCAPVEGFIDQQAALWKMKGDLNLLPDIRVAMMGWDPRPWHEKGFFWSDNTADKFRDLCQRAKASIDSSTGRSGIGSNTVLFCCWNEFGEGHYIEPTRGSGFAYLDAIRDVFCEGVKKHVDIIPQDVGLAPSDSWYLASRGAAQPGKDATSWSGQSIGQWTGSAGLDGVETRDGVLRGTSNSRDPVMSSPALELRASRYKRVIVEMRLSHPAGGAQLFWATTASGVSEAASVSVPTLADGRWHTYTFEVGQNPNWGGCVTAFRFDPTSEPGVTVEIKSIRLE